jgi:hypothetical protein
MQVFHALPATGLASSIAFDDTNLIAHAGSSRVLSTTVAAARPDRLALAGRVEEPIGRHRRDRPATARHGLSNLSTARRPLP